MLLLFYSLRIFHTFFVWWWQQVSFDLRTLLNIQAILTVLGGLDSLYSSSAFHFPRVFSTFWGIALRAPNMIGITFTFMFHYFKKISGNLSSSSTYFIFTVWFAETTKSSKRQIPLFLFFVYWFTLCKFFTLFVNGGFHRSTLLGIVADLSNVLV